ncbi:E2F transcription factor 3 [Mortierella claussenii]|nr:E2F transcription factor 3 [Mortierella claussenii]
MSSATHVMAAMPTMPTMPAFSGHAWVDRENRPNVSSHEPLPALVKSVKRGRKGGVIPSNGANKPKGSAAPKDSSRSERSLGMLTKQFIQLLKDESGTLDLNKTAGKLKVQKRRIYDITNVLEGIDLIEKFKKNNVRWKGVAATSSINKSAAGCKTALPGISRQRKEELMQERARLEQEHARLLQMRSHVDGAIKDTLTNENTARFAYVTMDDIKKVDSLQDSLVLAVNTPYETYIQVDEGSHDHSKPFVMKLEHKTQAGDVKLSSFMVPPRCMESASQSSDSSSEGSTDYSSLDDYSSQDDDSSCTDDSDDSSSSDDYSEDSSSDSSSDEEDVEPTSPMYKTMVGMRTILSSVPQQEVDIIHRAAVEEAEESETEYMSE